MKTLKLIGLVAVLAISQYGYSQTRPIAAYPTYSIVTDTSSTQPELATVGAEMPFRVIPDPDIASSAFYNASGFKWTYSVGTPLTNSAGAPLSNSAVDGNAGGYTSDYSIRAIMPGTASVGTVDIRVVERSNPTFNPLSGCEQATPRILPITVVAKPTATITFVNPVDTAQGGCAAAAPFTVNYNFSGVTSASYFPIYIDVVVKGYNMANVLQGTATVPYTIATSTDHLVLNDSILNLAYGLAWNSTATKTGRFAVSFGNLWDRVSIRAINAAAIATIATTAPKASIYIFPTPATGIIKHIK